MLSPYIFVGIPKLNRIPSSASQPTVAMSDGNQSPTAAVNGDPDRSTFGIGYVYPAWNVSGGGGGSRSRSVDPPNLHNGHADWHMSIGIVSGSSGSGDPRSLGNGYANLHGSGGGVSSSGSGYPRGLGNGYANLHGSSGGGSSSGSGDARSLGNGYANLHGSDGGGSSSGRGDPRSLGSGYANLHGSGGSGSSEPYNLLYGHPNWSGSGGGSAVDCRTPGYSYYSWYENGGGGPTVSPPSFTGMYAPHQAPTGYYYSYPTDAVPPFVPNGRQSRPPLPSGFQEVNVDGLISNQLGSLTIDSHRNTYLERGRLALAEFRNQRQQERSTARGLSNTLPAGVDNVNADLYRSMRLEDVRGSMRSVATELRGCQFLRRMVEERGADAVRDVFDGVAGDVVRLMGSPVSASLVDDMARLWTDEQVARVLRSLDESSPREVLEAARNHAG